MFGSTFLYDTVGADRAQNLVWDQFVLTLRGMYVNEEETRRRKANEVVYFLSQHFHDSYWYPECEIGLGQSPLLWLFLGGGEANREALGMID
jgi:hypothetical protein